MKLGYYKYSKVTDPYFSRKMSFAQKRAQNGQMDCFDISQNGLKVKVKVHEGSKVTDGNITQRGVK